MRQVLQKQVVFKKDHTNREIYQYIVDPDAEQLYLAVKPWYVIAHNAYLALNVVATFLSCFSLIVLTYPEYIDSSNYTQALNKFNVMEIMSVVFFTIDYCLRISATNKTILDFVVFDLMNVLDIFTTVPFYLQLIVANSGADPGDLFRVFFVIRMSRVIRLSRYHKGMNIIMESVRLSIPMLMLFWTIALILMLFWTIALIAIAIISSAIFFVENTRYDNASGLWFRRCPYTLRWFDANYTEIPNPSAQNCSAGEEISPIQSISDGMYWAAVIVSLNGFGDLMPTSVLGKVVAAITSCVAIILFVAPATIMTANYRQLKAEEERKEVTTQLSQLATAAMKAQEVLRKELERSYRTHKQEVEAEKFTKAGGKGAVDGEGNPLGGAGDPIAAIPTVNRTASALKKKRSKKSIFGSVGSASLNTAEGMSAQGSGDFGGAFELEDDDDPFGRARGHTAAVKAKKLRALQAVLPQSELSGKLRLEPGNEYLPICAFTFQGETKIIYEVKARSLYVYEPLLKLKVRDVVVQPDSDDDEPSKTPSSKTPTPKQPQAPKVVSPPETKREVVYTDDFNVRTAERILTCYIVLDSEEARTAARQALIANDIIDADAPEGDSLVLADRSGPINIQHDYQHIYPDLSSIVYLDELTNATATNTDDIGIRFVVVMPHLVGIEDAMRLLTNTRLAVSVGIRRKQFSYHFPLSMNCIMASRLIRELVPICYKRKEDGHQIAYVHQYDVQMLLEGFCDQFIPTPSPEVLTTAPYVVDQQVFLALKACCPSIRLDYVPLEAANSCYRSGHLNAQGGTEQFLMEIDLTLLSTLDELGYGTRIKLHVPMCEEIRYDAYLTMRP
ncbi:ion transporter, putative [Bodo saltans]|uniref:Ion transporter, putative n=1 Tax=Bodo saltans TaxID=75058 RepID=A0A0S4IM58_BODSA|nr:ion transporter, putative [Bodo saltans]|eukprot:CUF38773.1 ion transporter, putative [Bodo saltans]